MNTTLTINPELKDLLPPLSPRQFAKLESEILKDGCKTPLTLWGDTLVDGHNRYKICMEHNLTFQIVHKEFSSLDEAKLWMWTNQDGRRNLTRFARVEFALKIKDIVAAQSKGRQGKRNDLNNDFVQNSARSKRTRQQIAEFAGVSHDTVDRVEFILEHADEKTLNDLRWDVKGTSINKEFTRLKAELDAQKPKAEKKARSKSTTASEQNQTETDLKKSRSASSEEKTKAAKTETKTTKPNQEQASKSEPETTTSDAPPETTVVSLKSRRKVDDKYCCGVTFEPDPDDTEFDWLTEEERKELEAMREGCPNRIVPQIHNFTIQNIPEHSPEPLLTCLYDLFKVGYRKKLAYGLLRRMFDKDDAALARSIVDDLHNEFQNR